ncbi:hypothetical protein O6H91_09G051400 [Diphasiastrum complanatum]|uniref:Uncharacterized protein n=1 Tax=Diphasiastrum complanatum TaxID=34168 RepID=A0ACC2CP72_DIPCM|nr:hypothetical protein O6H91_09G051400 [Diphasiastrum complanatum]
MATIRRCNYSTMSIASYLRLWLRFFYILHAVDASTAAQAKQVYIAYLGHRSSLDPSRIEAEHHQMLAAATGSDVAAKDALIYHYKHSFRGFAAKLSKDEASTISRMAGVLSNFPSKGRTLQTTRSWQFLDVEKETSININPNSPTSNYYLWLKAKFGRDVIIGLLDTESKSFQDDSLSPIPRRWNGICENGSQLNASHCNRKLIGARMYVKGYEQMFGPLNITATGEYLSARDKDGHGTHTSSTAAGNFVADANTYGFGNGTAKGGAPRGRISMYKTCWPVLPNPEGDNSVCTEADMLAALDDGIHDGVDLFSISIGNSNPQRIFSEDAIAIGAFHAILKGIAVFCSAGNDGPTAATAFNLAPWIVTVAATTIDRSFPSPAILGNGTVLKGESISPYKLGDQFYPLIFAGSAGMDNTDASQCLSSSLDPVKVKGKVVLCMRGQGTRVGKGREVLNAGGIAYILGNSPSNGREVSLDAYVLPGTAINADDTVIAQEYIRLCRNAQVKIVPATTVVGIKPAPVVAAFSSRGPNSLNPDIIKPDIAAPGVNIVAAWTKANSPTGLPSDHRRVAYNIISGTSMACPHAAGAGALLKNIHPTWSPAAIKSALMTTGKLVNNLNQPITSASGKEAGPFDFGSGEVNPIAAADPGLVYDAKLKDYLLFLCKVGYKSSEIKLITGKKLSCDPKPPSISDLNYPSVAVTNLKKFKTVTRTVTNVGSMGTYNVTVQAPPGISLEITPNTLQFGAQGERRRFKIKLRVSQSSKGKYVFGSYTWFDGAHVVRSPIVVKSR